MIVVNGTLFLINWLVMKKYNYIGWCMAGSLGLSAMPGQAAQPEKKTTALSNPIITYSHPIRQQATGDYAPLHIRLLSMQPMVR